MRHTALRSVLVLLANLLQWTSIASPETDCSFRLHLRVFPCLGSFRWIRGPRSLFIDSDRTSLIRLYIPLRFKGVCRPRSCKALPDSKAMFARLVPYSASAFVGHMSDTKKLTYLSLPVIEKSIVVVIT
jgi:hypothetical protein